MKKEDARKRCGDILRITEWFEMDIKKVLITGGGGFLGRAVAKKCVERGYKVWSLSRNTYPALTAMGVVQIQGDVTHAMDVQKACKGKDVVFHLAARKGGWGRLSKFYKTNVKGTRNVIEACKNAKVRVLVYTSSTRATMDQNGCYADGMGKDYPDRFQNNFAMSKAFAEQAVLKASTQDFRCIVLRPHMIWGPGDTSVIPGLFKHRRWIFKIGNGQNKVSGIYIDNAADAHLLAAVKAFSDERLSGKVFVLAQDEPLILWDFIGKIETWTGKKMVLMSLPKSVVMPVGKMVECFFRLTDINRTPCLSRNIVIELADSHVFNINDLNCSLGFLPSVSVQKGFELYGAWLEHAKTHGRGNGYEKDERYH